MDTPAEDPLLLPGIYAITNTIDGATYIGSTKSACGIRWRVHRNNLINGKHVNTLLQAAVSILGIEVFSFAVLQTVKDPELLGQEEKKWFELFEAQEIPLYNVIPVRRGLTYHVRIPKLRLTKLCLYCGNPFPIYPSQARLKYCCHEHFILHTKRSIEERFWEQVDKSSGFKTCWLWTGSINEHGYGRFSICENGKGRWVLAHRFIFERINGPLLPGFFACHSCDVRPCVQLRHLLPGTAADNTADAMSRGRMASGDRSGASQHPEKVPRGENHWMKRDPARVLERTPRGDNHYMRRLPDARKRLQGENNHGCKLTDVQISMIRDLKGKMTCKQIGEQFGISAGHVSEIHNYKKRPLLTEQEEDQLPS